MSYRLESHEQERRIREKGRMILMYLEEYSEGTHALLNNSKENE